MCREFGSSLAGWLWFRFTCTVAKKLPARAATRLKIWLRMEDPQPTKMVYLQGCRQDTHFLCMELLSALVAWPLAWQMTQEKEQGGSSEAPFWQSCAIAHHHFSLILFFTVKLPSPAPLKDPFLKGRASKGLCTYLNTITENIGKERGGECVLFGAAEGGGLDSLMKIT